MTKACPALLYAQLVAPLGSGERSLSTYRDRLMMRLSFARVLREAEAYSEI